MKDPIERADAIEAVKGLPTWWADEGGYYGDAQPPMAALLEPEDVVSALENLPTAQPDLSSYSDKLWKAAYERGKAEAQPHWIPCKDHLPLFDFTDVLLLYHDKRHGCEDDYYIMQAYTVRGQWRPILRIEDSDMESMEPVAWMPLPEPWRAES